ncbi:hypothetical protein ACIQD3_22370 [Peribacillus loiseleuriae]
MAKVMLRVPIMLENKDPALCIYHPYTASAPICSLLLPDNEKI